jgi:glycosyltransferase involved in cell wall biosynthesis
MKTGIIIPCYNEAERLDTLAFVNFILSEEDYHLCFVNDGSKDNTLEVLENIQRECPNQVSVIDVKNNKGKAEAVRAGARYLYNQNEVEFIGFIDADLSTDFRDFKKLVQSLKDDSMLELVYGSRRKGGEIKRNFFRELLSNAIKSIIYLILGLPIEDTQCGAKVFRRSIIPVAYDKSFKTRWLFDVEIFIRLKHKFGKKTIMEVTQEQALERWIHVEDSKLGLKDSLMIPYKLMTIWLVYSFAYKY